MLALLLLGYLFPALDLTMQSVDLLPDLAGFVLLGILFIYLWRIKKVRGAALILISAGLLSSFLSVIIPSGLVPIFCRVINKLAFFFLARIFFVFFSPDRARGGADYIRYHSLLSAQFFLLFTGIFIGLLSIWPVLFWICFALQVALTLYIMVILCLNRKSILYSANE